MSANSSTQASRPFFRSPIKLSCCAFGLAALYAAGDFVLSPSRDSRNVDHDVLGGKILLTVNRVDNYRWYTESKTAVSVDLSFRIDVPGTYKMQAWTAVKDGQKVTGEWTYSAKEPGTVFNLKPEYDLDYLTVSRMVSGENSGTDTIYICQANGFNNPPEIPEKIKK